jgi:hypothetical protein
MAKKIKFEEMQATPRPLEREDTDAAGIDPGYVYKTSQFNTDIYIGNTPLKINASESTNMANQYTWATVSSETKKMPTATAAMRSKRSGDGSKFPDVDGYWVIILFTDDGEPKNSVLIEVCNGASEFCYLDDADLNLRSIDTLARGDMRSPAMYLFVY